MKKNSNILPEISQIEVLLYAIQPIPGESFHRRMTAAPWNAPSWQDPKSIKIARRTILAGILTAILLLAALGFTPAGRVLADGVIHFFTRAPGNSLPLPPDQVQPPVPTSTPVPTFFPSLLSATQVDRQVLEYNPFPTPALKPEQYQNLDMTKARSLAGFTLLEPAVLPKDYRLKNIRYDADLQAVIMSYVSPKASTGEFFSITQGKKLAQPKIGKDVQVERISACGRQVELVRGGWITLDGAAEATWENDMETYTFRWEENGISIELGFYMNDPFYPSYLGIVEMMNMVNDLTKCRPSVAGQTIVTQQNQAESNSVGDVYLKTEDAEKVYGNHIYQPSVLPDGLPFSHARLFGDGNMMLYYGNFAADKIHSNGTVLTISQGLKRTAQVNMYAGYPPEALEHLQINGQPAIAAQGYLFSINDANGHYQDKLEWREDPFSYSLSWQIKDRYFMVQFSAGFQSGARISREDMIKIAESIK